MKLSAKRRRIAAAAGALSSSSAALLLVSNSHPSADFFGGFGVGLGVVLGTAFLVYRSRRR